MDWHEYLRSARFYAILDAAYVARRDWLAKCRALLAGGADIVQMRAKSVSTSERRELLEEILPLFSDTKVPLVINDHIELALDYPRLGLHVGQDDLDSLSARGSLGPDRLLGLSTHSAEQARRAIQLDHILNYFAVGPVFPTATKPDYQAVGIDLVQEIADWERTSKRFVPWFCIGGINRENVAMVRTAGAHRIVAVSDPLQAEDTASAVQVLRRGIALDN